jgi:16S rRNA (guanine1207-N2)-methyltransferase
LRRDDPLRAWDAADKYLLDEFGPAARGRILIVHDSFGALAVALHEQAPQEHPLVWWSDSFLAHQALYHNLALNGRGTAAATVVTGDCVPEGIFDLVLMKIPKAMSHFEDLLLKLRSRLALGARVAAGGMIKHVPMRAWRLMEDVIGPTVTSRGRQKARYGEALFEAGRDLPGALVDQPLVWGDPPLTLMSGPNVFSRGKIDHGSALLLQHLPSTDEPLRAADLGCGNGILALALARACPHATILAVDESFQAVAATAANAEAAGLDDRVTAVAGDGLADVAAGSLDLVVCNPPFHQDHAVGDQLAWRMITQAKHALAPGGELRLVGNRHLGYHAKLELLFGACRTLGSDRRFVVLAATRN